MKKIILLTTIFFSLFLVSGFTCIESHDYSEEQFIEESRVYICGGNYAERFHSHSKCRGLNNCKADIYYMDSQQEAQKEGYTHCKICWK